MSQFLAPVLQPGGGGGRALAAPAPARRLRRAGAGQGAARDRARGGDGARRGARPRAARRPARARQDDACADRARGARRRAPHRRRAGARAQGRHGGDPHRRSRARDVLFVDEIHRVNRAIEEILYPALEDFRLDIIVGQGAGGAHADARPARLHARRRDDPYRAADDAAARPVRDDLPARPLRARRARRRSSAARRASSASSSTTRRPRRSRARSRGTPRVANRILRRVRDVAEVRHEGVITTEVAREALELLEVDERGLERTDRELLGADRAQVRGRPGRALDARRRARRGARHDRGRLRAVPAAARLPPADAARPRGHRARPRARRRDRRRRRRSVLSSRRSGRPGAAGPLDELVARIRRRIEAVREEHGLEQAEVRSSSYDGRELVVAVDLAGARLWLLSFTLQPHQDDERAAPSDRPDRRGQADRDLDQPDRRAPRRVRRRGVVVPAVTGSSA